jgi:hypothetical protein
MARSDQAILDYIAAHPGARRAEIRRHAAGEASKTTVWRALKRLVDEGRLEVSGRGPATGYSLAGAAVVRAHLQTPYNRRKPASYKKEFLDRYIPGKTIYLAESDRQRLREAGTPVIASLPAGTYARRILERLLVDLSWASSRMEGNTYNLLETEGTAQAHARRHHPFKLQAARRPVRDRRGIRHTGTEGSGHYGPVRAVLLSARPHPLFTGVRRHQQKNLPHCLQHPFAQGRSGADVVSHYG